MGKYSSMYNVERANIARGHHFFSPESKRFFRSRIGTRLINGRYFITSEQFDWKSPRLYTVRRAEDDGSIETVGEFQQFDTAAKARRYAEKLADESSPCANCRKPTYNRNFTCDECSK